VSLGIFSETHRNVAFSRELGLSNKPKSMWCLNGNGTLAILAETSTFNKWTH